MSHFHLFVCPLSFLPLLFLEVRFRLLPTKKFIRASLLSNGFISIFENLLYQSAKVPNFGILKK